jgi:O-antigen biosynthesis protein
LHASGSKSIVGSHSRDLSGESVSHENGFNLSNPYNRRVKRLIDISIAVIGLLTFPLQFFLVKKPFSFFANCFSVIAGTKTWIGYASAEKNIPNLRRAVIACNGVPSKIRQSLPKESLQMIDYWYARDYEPLNDLKLIARVYRKLGE